MSSSPAPSAVASTPSTAAERPYGAPAEGSPPAWQVCLDVRNSDGRLYQDHFNPTLLESLAGPPRHLLDIGCASGVLGMMVKEAHPQCRVTGIEPNLATANVARTRLDQVLCGLLEDFDLEKEGIARSSIDTVVAADVLEHMYDPWRAMISLKPYLTADAQFIISIPNTRHLKVSGDLIEKGEWTYAEKGLLDITHIRFFTLKEITRLITETGYQLEHVNYLLDPLLEPVYQQNVNQREINLRMGRLTLERLLPQELAELCAWQFFLRARPIFD